MPAVIHRDTASSILADLRSRVAKLETTPPNGMTSISRTLFGSVSGLGVGTTYTDAAVSRTAPFTLTRSLPLFVVGVLGAVTITQNGGTCPGGSVVLVLHAYPLVGVLPANDINGVPMISAQSLVWSNSGNGINVFSMLSFVVPDGTYIASFQYLGLPPVTSALFGFNNGEVDIFSLAG